MTERDCLITRERLGEHVRDELDADEQKAVEAHLVACRPCRRELEAARALLTATRRLPEEVEPRRDLWPEIEARLAASETASPQRRPWLPVAVAAVVALLVLLPVTLDRLTPVEEGPDRAAGPATPTSDDAFTGATGAYLADGFLHARSDLTVAVETRRSALGRAEAAELVDSVRLLDQAVGEIHAALVRSPDDPRLHHLLATHYRQQTRIAKKLQGV